MANEARTAIVTGGGKRIGEAIVRALLDDGWTVIAHVHQDGDPAPEGAIKVVAELGQQDCARTIFAGTEGHPPVRLLVNNASRFTFDGFGEVNAVEFDRHLQVNTRAPMLLIDELARRHGGGDALVVNMLDAKLAAPNPDFLSYTISKYALAGLGELAARALAGHGIRVNAIAPAVMLPSGEQSAENFEAVHEFNPLRRGIQAADVVAALRFLIESTGVTGQTLTLDGGQRFMNLARDVQLLG